MFKRQKSLISKRYGMMEWTSATLTTECHVSSYALARPFRVALSATVFFRRVTDMSNSHVEAGLRL